MQITPQIPQAHFEENEIDLAALFRYLLARYKFIVLFIGIGLAVAIGVALYLPNKYEATMVVVPAKQESGGGLGALAAQFGGLAAMSGLSIGKAGGRSDEALELIKSWPFLDSIINKYQLKPALLAAKKWDKKTKQLVFDEKKYLAATGEWLTKNEGGVVGEPNSWKAFKALDAELTVSKDPKSGLIRLKLLNVSPENASRWLSLVVVEANNHFRKIDLAESKNNIDYLNAKVNETSVAEMRTMFYNMIEEQTKNLMLAEASKEYFLKTVVPVREPEVKAKPARALIVVLGGMLGGFLGVAVALVGYFRQQKVVI